MKNLKSILLAGVILTGCGTAEDDARLESSASALSAVPAAGSNVQRVANLFAAAGSFKSCSFFVGLSAKGPDTNYHSVTVNANVPGDTLAQTYWNPSIKITETNRWFGWGNTVRVDATYRKVANAAFSLPAQDRFTFTYDSEGRLESVRVQSWFKDLIIWKTELDATCAAN